MLGLREALSCGSLNAEPDSELSDRERDVLLALEQGLRLVEVAVTLVLSENTVKTCLRWIYGKPGVVKRHDAMSRARLTGHFSLPSCCVSPR